MLNIVETSNLMLEEEMKRLIEDKEQEIETLKKRVTSLTTQLEEKEMVNQESMYQFILLL